MDNPTCEGRTFQDKFITLYRFIDHNINEKIGYSMDITYNYRDLNDRSRILSSLAFEQSNVGEYESYKNKSNAMIKNLIEFGQKIDGFIQDKNDFFFLEHILNTLDEDIEYNSFYFFKMMTLVEMLVKNPKHSKWLQEDYYNLIRYIPNEIGSKKEKLATLLIQIRNSIAHADYKKLEKRIEEYINQFMINYYFDYYEYSRNNWAFINMSCILNEIVAKIINLYLQDKHLMLERRMGKHSL